jgi:NAD(P)-dependent dehydrogenase (short-subunit alcohol dehydrogenase family)
MRIPFSSDYSTSKFALGRLIEFAALGGSWSFVDLTPSNQSFYTEYPELRVFALHPGTVETAMTAQSGVPPSSVSFDTIALPAATALTISAGKAEWLRGRFTHRFNYVEKAAR